jgi:hypothetical protein
VALDMSSVSVASSGDFNRFEEEEEQYECGVGRWRTRQISTQVSKASLTFLFGTSRNLTKQIACCVCEQKVEIRHVKIFI